MNEEDKAVGTNGPNFGRNSRIILIPVLVVVAFLVLFLLIYGLENLSLPSTSWQNKTIEAFVISPLNSSSQIPVYLILNSDECGYLINHTYVFELPYNFTIDKSFIPQEEILPANSTVRDYHVYFSVYAYSPFLFCTVYTRINNSFYYLYPIIKNGTLIKA